jgi:PIN domain nuclease of toxin-antitoxin system
VIYVLDGSAMLAFLRDEAGADVVEALLLDPSHTCIAHAINLCEVFYDYHRAGGEAVAQSALTRLLSATILPRADLDTGFWQEAGRRKAAFRRVSLADCFCMTLAQRVNGVVVTSDHHEFDAIAPLGLCPIQFIR